MEYGPLDEARPASDVVYCPTCQRQLPHRALRADCEDCLNRRYLETMLQRESGYMDDPLELVPDRHKRKHLSLTGDRRLAYCGVPLSATRDLRKKVGFGDLPEGICELCRSVLGLLRAGKYSRPEEGM
jgi:hypothetical protein